ncbi:hypothetical protein L1987_03461 [Smallanthus sonchifolius]|uniref:Uncharacterized protein n=1 Tax=Smallanthus sonchifolius TaxID=185202 RepID=A0ACB9KAN2_9ASTR|nr:hypothetical protein L1987_03461 [Smallanthus sonchifolius]
MAYYEDGYIWAQEHTTYSHDVAYQDQVSFSSYEPYGVDSNYDAYNVSLFHEPKSIDHGDYGYNCDNNYDAYNVSLYHEPKSIDHGDYGFNEPEFEEYDPTPYGGGYDIISVYGKPIPPSDQTFEPKPEPKPKSGPMPIATNIPLVEPESKSEPKPKPKPKPKPVHALVPVPDPIELKEVGEREREKYTYPDYGYDYPWPEYDHANATGVGYDYGYGKQVVQIPPCEYSPEVVDLCESIFGSWPCLARIRKQQMNIQNSP